MDALSLRLVAGTPRRMLSDDGTFLKVLLRRLNELVIQVLGMTPGSEGVLQKRLLLLWPSEQLGHHGAKKIIMTQ